MTRKSSTLDDLKSHYALCYANRAVLLLNGTSKGVNNGTYRWTRRGRVLVGCQ